MSIRSEILHLLNINSHTETRELAGTIVLPVSFTGSQGHFPGNPTLPGVCEIMILKELLRQGAGIHADHAEIRNAKFFAPAGADEVLELSCAISQNTASCRIMSGEKKICALKLSWEGNCNEA